MQPGPRHAVHRGRLGFELQDQLSLEVEADSSAARSRGSGEVWHLEAAECLWIPQAIASDKVAVLVKGARELNE